MRASLYCVFCGHALHEVALTRDSGRPTLRELRRAYDETPDTERPYWGGGRPSCPRCGGLMFLELLRPRTAIAASA